MVRSCGKEAAGASSPFNLTARLTDQVSIDGLASGARPLAVKATGTRGDASAIARVYLDGALVGFVDTYASPSQGQTVLFTTSGLTSGPHTVAVEATHERNVDSKGRWVWVDAFDVLP